METELNVGVGAKGPTKVWGVWSEKRDKGVYTIGVLFLLEIESSNNQIFWQLIYFSF